MFNPNTTEYTFFATVYGYTLKLITNWYTNMVSTNNKKIKATICILSDHTGTKLEINSERNHLKYMNPCRLNNTLLNFTLLNNDWVTEEVKK